MPQVEEQAGAGGNRARPLRLTIIGPAPPLRGGIAHYTTALVRSLRARHQVQVVGLTRLYPKLLFPGTTEEDRSAVAIRLAVDVRLDPLRPWTWRAAEDSVASFRPDVILVSWWQPALGAVLAGFTRRLRRRGPRLLFLCHNLAAHDSTPIDRLLTSLALRVPDAAIVHSEADAAELRRRKPALRVLRTNHPAYDLSEFGPPLEAEQARDHLGVSGSMILFFGLVRRYKGLEDLIRALPSILRVHPCTLLVAGEFYEPRARYEQLVADLKLQAHVQLRDRYVPNEEVGVYFSGADMIVAPYRAATQSGVVALAQQFQRPVIVTRVGGLPQMIRDGVTGLVVPPADPEAIAAASLRIYAEGVDHWHMRMRQARTNTWAEEVDAIERLAAV
jgi:glycosyltransferase involved in cell wall biosynthesis